MAALSTEPAPFHSISSQKLDLFIQPSFLPNAYNHEEGISAAIGPVSSRCADLV